MVQTGKDIQQSTAAGSVRALPCHSERREEWYGSGTMMIFNEQDGKEGELQGSGVARMRGHCACPRCLDASPSPKVCGGQLDRHNAPMLPVSSLKIGLRAPRALSRMGQPPRLSSPHPPPCPYRRRPDRLSLLVVKMHLCVTTFGGTLIISYFVARSQNGI